VTPKEIYPIVGMSPGNSYFRQEVVTFLINRVVSEFGKTGVLIPDIPAIATYQALGYDLNRARRDKAIPKGNSLRNKVKEAIKQGGLMESQVHVFDWREEIESNACYQEKLFMIKTLCRDNKQFGEAVRTATKEVLVTSKKQIKDLEEAITVAAHYILSEFAFLEFLPEYLHVEKVVYIYHKPWPVYEDYITGKFDGVQREYLNFLIIKR
jgi:cyclo(L-tyrosyl-L-tyrosyl) synthase